MNRLQLNRSCERHTTRSVACCSMQRCLCEGLWSGKYTYTRFFQHVPCFLWSCSIVDATAFPVCYVIVYHLNCCLPPLHVFATSKPQLPSTSRPAVGPLILRQAESVGVSTWYTCWVPRCIKVPCSIKWTRWFEWCLFFYIVQFPLISTKKMSYLMRICFSWHVVNSASKITWGSDIWTSVTMPSSEDLRKLLMDWIVWNDVVFDWCWYFFV